MSVASASPVSEPFSRDAWEVEDLEVIAEYFEAGLSEYPGIASVLADRRIGTTTSEVGQIVSRVKRAHWHENKKPDNQEIARCFRKEAQRRRLTGRRPIQSYEIEIVGNLHSSASPATESSTNDGAITINVVGDQARECLIPDRPVYIYIDSINVGDERYAKIGISNNPEHRAVVLATGVPGDVVVEYRIEVPSVYDPYEVEREVHKRYPGHLRRELFRYCHVGDFKKAYHEAIAHLGKKTG